MKKENPSENSIRTESEDAAAKRAAVADKVAYLLARTWVRRQQADPAGAATPATEPQPTRRPGGGHPRREKPAT